MPRALRVTCEADYDGSTTAFNSRPFEEPNTLLPMVDGEGCAARSCGTRLTVFSSLPVANWVSSRVYSSPYRSSRRNLGFFLLPTERAANRSFGSP